MAKIKFKHKEFKSKTELRKEIQEVKKRWLNDETIEGADFETLSELILLHPSFEEKIGVGIKAFRLKYFTMGSRCFFIERLDGSEVDFSYTSCIKSDVLNAKTLFDRAARLAIDEQVIEFKAGRTGHAHHKEPHTFAVIVQYFIKSREIDIEDVQINDDKTFKSTELLEDFRKFHKELVEFELLSEEDHKLIHQKEWISKKLKSIKEKLNANVSLVENPVQTRWFIDSIEMNMDDVERCKAWLDQLKELNKNIL
jgi:hypothetical protein